MVRAHPKMRDGNCSLWAGTIICQLASVAFHGWYFTMSSKPDCFAGIF
jgi:hypothetical protein